MEVIYTLGYKANLYLMFNNILVFLKAWNYIH